MIMASLGKGEGFCCKYPFQVVIAVDGFEKEFSSTNSKSSQRGREGGWEEDRTCMSFFPNQHAYRIFKEEKT